VATKAFGKNLGFACKRQGHFWPCLIEIRTL